MLMITTCISLPLSMWNDYCTKTCKTGICERGTKERERWSSALMRLLLFFLDIVVPLLMEWTWVGLGSNFRCFRVCWSIAGAGWMKGKPPSINTTLSSSSSFSPSSFPSLPYLPRDDMRLPLSFSLSLSLPHKKKWFVDGKKRRSK